MTKMTKMTEMTKTRRQQRSMRWADVGPRQPARGAGGVVAAAGAAADAELERAAAALDVEVVAELALGDQQLAAQADGGREAHEQRLRALERDAVEELARRAHVAVDVQQHRAAERARELAEHLADLDAVGERPLRHGVRGRRASRVDASGGAVISRDLP